MASIQHASIPDAQLHEPKGVAGAASGKVYLADGAGSGVWKYPAGGAYGEIYISSGSTAFALAAASAYSKLDPGNDWDDNGHLNMTLSGNTGEITALVPGTYMLSFWASFATAALAAGTAYFFKYAINGSVGTRLIGVQKNTAGVDVINVSAQGIVTLAANDIISMYAAGDGTSSSTNITVQESGLNAFLLKAT